MIVHLLHLLPVYCSVQENEASSPNSAVSRRPRTAIVKEKSVNLEWKLEPRNCTYNALYSGLRSLEPNNEYLYIGTLGPILDSAGNIAEGPIVAKLLDPTTKEHAELIYALRQLNCVAIFTEEKESQGHYEGYCKGTLWPLFHYILNDVVSDGRQELKDWDSYCRVNKIFADAAVREYQQDDVIWVHDYHLMLVPAMIREMQPIAGIGLFLHTPFPSSEVFRCLPKRTELLEGTLGASLIGFQTYSYARHYISCCTRVLGLESTPNGVEYLGKHVNVGIFPIGIDVKRVDVLRRQPNVMEHILKLKEMHKDKKIIVGRDKLDPNRGIYQKLLAFLKFLELFPEWRNQVVLVQVSTAAQENAKLEKKIADLVSMINSQYGSISYMPVVHTRCKLVQSEYYALLSVADVALITPIRDGMNTTAQEFVVCQRDQMSPLILSEFTGTAGSLSSAILVNPWDTMGVAYAINEALQMPMDEREQRHTQMINHFSMFTSQHWASSFIKSLSGQVSLPENSHTTPHLDINACLKSYQNSKKRLILYDYDGTLTPIVKHPDTAIPSKQLHDALCNLCADEKNSVFVISGRDQQFLENYLDIPGIGLSAEHGCFLKSKNQKEWMDFSEDLDLSWKNDVVDIFSYYTERTFGSFIEHKRCSVTWHYRLADPGFGEFQAKECQNHLESAILSKLPVEILIGKKNLEVRPFAINKGEIVNHLLNDEYDFIFCIGDDKTDEDMFKVLKNTKSWCVTIGAPTKRTNAFWHLTGPHAVVSLINLWNKSVSHCGS